MEQSHTGASFQSTQWSMVLGAAGRDRTALEQLLRSYWSPVYTFIRRQGYRGHDASDLTQEFMTQVVIGRELVARANPERGRFRSFLKQALRNFLIDQHRLGRVHRGTGTTAPVEEGKRARPSSAMSIDDPSSGAARLADTSTAGSEPLKGDESFDREWAAAVIEITLDRLEESCIADGLVPHWKAFYANVVSPAIRKTNPIPLDKLAPAIGAMDATQASNMIQTVKRKFRKVLYEVVLETVRDPALVDDEIAELRRHFGVNN